MFLQCRITYVIGAHVVPKSWLSPDDLLDFDYNFGDDEKFNPNDYISTDLQGHLEGTHQEELTMSYQHYCSKDSLH